MPANDEFYLPEEVWEWLGLKKSEYLSRLIGLMDPKDFQFDEFTQFDDLIPSTLATPDWYVERKEDGFQLKMFVRTYSQKEIFYQVVSGALIPDQAKEDVFIPILSFVTRKLDLIEKFSAGGISTKPTLN